MIKRVKQIVAIASLAAVTAGLAGCAGGQKTVKHDYDVYVFNAKSENADAMERLCKEYEKEKNVKVKVFSLGTTEAGDTLRSAMNSDEKPTVFSVGAGALAEWKEGGFVKDLSASIPELKSLAESVPESMRLKSTDGENFGIPYNIEGYGLITDKKMIADLFGLTDTTGFINDFKAANYEEFQKLVIAVDGFIKENKSGSVVLNGKSYQLAKTKTSLTSKLNGVFSVAGAEKWTYGDHFSNYPLNTVFDSLSAAQNATDAQLEELRTPLEKSVQALDFETSYLAGPNGALK
ncbi:MAG: ABC transporter substrate-binding protein, partial [Clostridiaceae bacterium]